MGEGGYGLLSENALGERLGSEHNLDFWISGRCSKTHGPGSTRGVSVIGVFKLQCMVGELTCCLLFVLMGGRCGPLLQS